MNQVTISLHKHKIHRRNQTNERRQMIPMQRFTFKEDSSEHCKNNKCYHLLDDFQLHQRKRASIAYKADAIGRYLTGIFV